MYVTAASPRKDRREERGGCDTGYNSHWSPSDVEHQKVSVKYQSQVQVSVLGLNFKTSGFICGELLWFEVRIVIEMSNELYLESKQNKFPFLEQRWQSLNTLTWKCKTIYSPAMLKPLLVILWYQVSRIASKTLRMMANVICIFCTTTKTRCLRNPRVKKGERMYCLLSHNKI